MAERRLQKDKILPCFLDRLTDHYPRAKKEGRDHKIVNLKQYKNSVARDLEYLFNNLSVPDEDLLKDYPYVKESVINYGIKSMSGSWASRKNTNQIIKEIKQAILLYEPRIMKKTLNVSVSKHKNTSEKSKINFDIEGELWAEPITEKLYIKTEIDLETGECRIS